MATSPDSPKSKCLAAVISPALIVRLRRDTFSVSLVTQEVMICH